jgi:hypothetical protein
MTDRSTFESRLESRLIVRASIAARPFDAAVIARSAAIAGGSQQRSGGRLAWLGAPASRPLVVALVLALLVLAAAIVAIGSGLLRQPERLPGRIEPTGRIATPVTFSADALLADGRVLFAGGTAQGGDSDPVRAEVYDPSTNAFSTTQAMVQARSSASATTLDDGRVLIAGGSAANTNGSVAMSTAELFEPGAGTFVSTGSLYFARIGPVAVRLADGRVLLVGGTTVDPGGTNVDLSTAEIYDPATGTWTATGSMPSARTAGGGNGQGRPTATLLADGRVLIAGGLGSIGPLASAVLFDPRTGSFVATGSMTVGRSNAAATLLADGRVLIIGGDATLTQTPLPAVALASAEIFDPSTGRFSATGSLRTERFEESATLLPDGRVLVAGGSNSFGQPLSTELYDPATGTFSLGPTAASAHSRFAALLPTGRVLLAGDQPELFDPRGTPAQVVAPTPRTDRTFAQTGDPIERRQAHTATLLRDGRVLIVGGAAPDGHVLDSAEVYDSRSGTFTVTGSMATPREGQTALLLGDGRVLILGGYPGLSGVGAQGTVEAYDPATGQFRTVGSLDLDALSRVEQISAVELSGGRILVFVAHDPPAGSIAAADSAVLTFDQETGRTATLATLAGCTLAGGDAVLADGRVVVSCLDSNQSPVLRLFDPATAGLASLPLNVSGDSMVGLPDGRVVIDQGGTSAIQVFDPAVGRITAADSLPSPSAGDAAIALSDGRVLFLGGTEANLFDPATGHFQPLAPPLTSLAGETLTRLADGRILIVGGTSQPPDRTTPPPPGAELFDPAPLP